MTTYLILFLISNLVFLLMHFVSIQFAKIEAIKENRLTNSVSLLPIIPLAPIFLVIVAWAINTKFSPIGFQVISFILAALFLIGLFQSVITMRWLSKNNNT